MPLKFKEDQLKYVRRWKKRKKIIEQKYPRRKGIKPTKQKLTNKIILKTILESKHMWAFKLMIKLRKKGYPKTYRAVCYMVRRLILLRLVKYIGRGKNNKKYFTAVYEPEFEKVNKNIYQIKTKLNLIK